MRLSFQNDIKEMFREMDVDAMIPFGFNLSVYDDVRLYAQSIYDRLSDGSMPCDGAWPPEQIEKFKRWMDEGMEP